MAMTLRLPEELDAALETIAAAEHTSKHAVVLSGLEDLVRRRLHEADVDEALEKVLRRDARLLERLKSA